VDKVETVELEVTRKTKIKSVFNVDRSLEVYNREIERLYTGGKKIKEIELDKRINTHLNKLRKSNG
jgi:uncharacterized protein YaiL (DUF2058 family)